MNSTSCAEVGGVVSFGGLQQFVGKRTLAARQQGSQHGGGQQVFFMRQHHFPLFAVVMPQLYRPVHARRITFRPCRSGICHIMHSLYNAQSDDTA